MVFKKTKRTDRPTKNTKRQTRPETQGSGSAESEMDDIGYRMLTGICIAAVAGSLLLLGFFFSSDVRSNIIAAKTTMVHAETSDGAGDTVVSGVSDSTPDLVDALNNPNVSREEVIAHLNRMNEEDFQVFIEAVTDESSTEETEGTETRSASEKLYEMLAEGESVGKSDIIAYFKEMDDAEFDSYIESLVTAFGPEPSSKGSTSSDSLQPTVEDAYAEAERLHPGQINASKRLKLVEDLNAKDYMYYVAEEGDTLIKLSRAFNVPLGQLIELNGIHDADVIPAGMILLFPSATEQPDLEKDTE